MQYRVTSRGPLIGMAEYVVAITDGLLWAAPERAGTPVGGLPRDTLARVLDRKGDWIRVETEHEQQGWVEYTTVRLLDDPALAAVPSPSSSPPPSSTGSVASPPPPPSERVPSAAKRGWGIQPWLVIGGGIAPPGWMRFRLGAPGKHLAALGWRSEVAATLVRLADVAHARGDDEEATATRRLWHSTANSGTSGCPRRPWCTSVWPCWRLSAGTG
jgi:hypothetical protein